MAQLSTLQWLHVSVFLAVKREGRLVYWHAENEPLCCREVYVGENGKRIFDGTLLCFSLLQPLLPSTLFQSLEAIQGGSIIIGADATRKETDSDGRTVEDYHLNSKFLK